MAAAAIFGALSLILYLISLVIIPANPMARSFEMMIVDLSISLTVLVISSILRAFDRRSAATALTVLFWLLLFLLFTYRGIPYLLISTRYDFRPAILFISWAMALRILASYMSRNGSMLYGAELLRTLSIASLFLAIWGFLFSMAVVRNFSMFFLPLALYEVAMSPYAIMVSSRNENIRTAGRFMASISHRLAYLSAVTGILLVVLYYPKAAYLNDIILAILFILVVASVVGITWKLHNIEYEKLNSITDEIYRKHRFVEKLSGDERLKYLSDVLEQFIKTGEKDKILVTLSHMLGSAGVSLNTGKEMLKPIMEYRKPDPLLYRSRLIRKRKEREISDRNEILNLMLSRMKDLWKGGIDNNR